MLAALALVAGAASASTGSYFQYSGIGLDDFDLKERFPTSRTQDDTVWLSESDSRGHVYYLSRSRDRKEIRMVLEKPDEYLRVQPKTWKERHYARFPECRGVMTDLTRRYGSPRRVEELPEERLLNRIRTWSHGGETLQLICYRIDGRGKELAAEIWIRRTN